MRRLAVALALLGAACTPLVVPLPEAPVPAGPGIVVDAQPVPLDPTDPTRTRLGTFTYGGGLALTSRQTSQEPQRSCIHQDSGVTGSQLTGLT